MSSGGEPKDPLPLATPARRLAGFLLDVIIYVGIATVALIIVGTDFDALARGDDVVSGPVLFMIVIVIGVYQVTLITSRGQTVGKMLVRTRVIDDTSRGLPSFQQAFVRWGAPAAVGAVPWLSLLAPLMYAWLLRDPRRQGLHDKLAGTMVVSVT